MACHFPLLGITPENTISHVVLTFVHSQGGTTEAIDSLK